MPQRKDPTTAEEKDEKMSFPGLACGDFGCWPYTLMTFDEFLKMKEQRTELQPSPKQSGSS